MIIKYFNKQSIREYLTTRKSIEKSEDLFVASIADLLIISEEVKTGAIEVANFESCIGAMQESNVYIKNLTREDLIDNMFDENEARIADFVNNSTRPPHLTANYIALKPTIRSYWEESVLDDMLTEFV